MNKIKKELFETFEDLKDVTINGETFKARGKMVFLTADNKELEEAVEEKAVAVKVVKNASTGKNK